MSDKDTPAVPSGAVEALARQLEGRDPFDVMDEQLPALRALTSTLTVGGLRTPEAPGKWSVIEVVQHLADAELAYGWRLRMVIAHDRPPLQGFDQDLWAQRLGYRDAALNDALEQLQVLRTANLRLLRSLEEPQLDRVGIHSEAGPMSARMILYTLANHDRVHLAQIARIKRAIA